MNESSPDIIVEAEPVVLRPAVCDSEEIVSIRVAGATIRTFADYSESRRQILKSLRYQWKSPYWERTISSYAGSLEDRLIELSYQLLNSGHIILLPRPDLQERVLTGDYEDEPTRWVMRRVGGKYEDWLAVSWFGRRENFFDQAKLIKSARWSKPAVVIRAQHFEEVLDFAEIHDFRFSDGALELIEMARRKKESAVRVELKPRAKRAKNSLTAATTAPTGRIDDELKDE